MTDVVILTCFYETIVVDDKLPKVLLPSLYWKILPSRCWETFLGDREMKIPHWGQETFHDDRKMKTVLLCGWNPQGHRKRKIFLLWGWDALVIMAVTNTSVLYAWFLRFRIEGFGETLFRSINLDSCPECGIVGLEYRVDNAGDPASAVILQQK